MLLVINMSISIVWWRTGVRAGSWVVEREFRLSAVCPARTGSEKACGGAATAAAIVSEHSSLLGPFTRAATSLQTVSRLRIHMYLYPLANNVHKSTYTSVE